jgi:hypothetical protein
MTNTHAVLNHYNIDTSLVADADVPVLGGLQRQGDVFIAPSKGGADHGTRVGPSGVPVVRGEAGGNTHLLIAVEGAVSWRPIAPSSRLDPGLGVVTVPVGSVAGLAHPEHGLLLMGPGSYSVSRQRQQADEIRLVAD